MTTAQVRAVIGARKFRKQLDRGIRLIALDLLEILDEENPNAVFSGVDDLYIAIDEIGIEFYSANILYEKLLPRAEADRSIRRGYPPAPWYRYSSLLEYARLRACDMIIEAALFIERLEMLGNSEKMV